jgi:hypothetical protein
VFFLENTAISLSSVAEPVPEPVPEPVELQLFAGAVAQVFWPGTGPGFGYVNSYKMLQIALNFYILKFEV